MKKLILLFLLTVISISLSAQDKVVFSFKHHKGDAVSHISTVQEEAYLNGRLNNKTEFINRTSTTIKDVDADGNALLHTHYMTTQNSLMNRSGNYLSWGEEDFVNIHRRLNGELFNSDNDFLPTVRSVPAFSEEAVGVGESWTFNGFEVHDCRELFGMTSAIEIPFTATYTYIGDIEQNEKTLQIIEVYYDFYQEKPASLKYGTYRGATGFAKQKIFWDNDIGDLDHYTEQFQIKMVDSYGNSFIFNGLSHGEVTEYKSVNDETNAKNLQKTLDKYNLDNITVNKGEKGLTITLENIQFEPDSNILLPSEKKKLKKIAEILKDFSNDLLITGHCAERGTEGARQRLSEERAQSVADYLVQLGTRDEFHIFTQGKGSTQPIASNATEAGRSKNRRVEITIMD